MMKFNVVLINPGPVSKPNKKKGAASTVLYPPLSILYLSSVLKNHNYQVDVIDQCAQKMYLDDILKWIKWTIILVPIAAILPPAAELTFQEKRRINRKFLVHISLEVKCLKEMP